MKQKVPFDVTKARQGAKVVTRDGHNVRIVCYDKMGAYPIVGLKESEGVETPNEYTNEGVCFEYYDDDLFIEEEEETDNFDPYKSVVESIAQMAEIVEICSDGDFEDFYNNVKVKCKEAVEYEKKWLKKQSNDAEDVKLLDIKDAKDGEQKSFNTVKPKFKVGDWIVNKGRSYLIADIDYLDNRYLFELGGYTHEKLNWEYIKHADEHYHLWTIKDAKSGDILASKDELDILIFKNLDNTECFSSYYNATVRDNSVWDNSCFVPATKHQRDLLFQKMKEEGFQWDSARKELKKIKRRMTKQEVAWWLRDCPNEHREYMYEDGARVFSADYDYLIDEADEEVNNIYIRKNGGEWEEPLVEL